MPSLLDGNQRAPAPTRSTGLSSSVSTSFSCGQRSTAWHSHGSTRCCDSLLRLGAGLHCTGTVLYLARHCRADAVLTTRATLPQDAVCCIDKELITGDYVQCQGACRKTFYHVECVRAAQAAMGCGQRWCAQCGVQVAQEWNTIPNKYGRGR